MKTKKNLIEFAVPLLAIKEVSARIAAGRLGGGADSKSNLEEPDAPNPRGETNDRLF